MNKFLKKVVYASFLIGAVSCKMGVAASNQNAFDHPESRKLSLVIGPVLRSISYDDLKVFAETGEARGDIGNFLNIGKLDPQKMRSYLTMPLELNLIEMDKLLNSSLGVSVLEKVGKVIHPRHTPSYAVETIRSAIVMSLEDDNKLNFLEVVEHLPVDVQIEVEQLLAMKGEIAGLFGTN